MPSIFPRSGRSSGSAAVSSSADSGVKVDATAKYVPLADQEEEAHVLSLASVLDMDEESLRGISLSALLANRAQLFEDNGKAAREDPIGTFALSQPVDSLSYFVSHSWRTSRLVKHMALCVHFNLERAAFASATANLLVFTLQLFCREALPPWLVIDQVHVADYSFARGGMLCQLTAPLVFIPVLLFGHAFDHDCTCFLDIACISQTDERKKATGIASLGAILDRSERMLVLCDGHYFSRLWCLFEISAFTKRAGASRIDLVALHVPLRIAGWVLCFALFYAAMTSVLWPVVGTTIMSLMYESTSPITIPLYTTVWMLIGMPAVLFAEVEARAIRTALVGLRRFKLTDAQCYSDADRAAILALISQWWTDHASGETDPARLRALGFHRFERFVRHQLAPELLGLAGGEWTRSSFLALYVVGSHGWILDLLTYSNATTYHALSYVCYALFCYGAWQPMLYQLIKLLAGTVLSMQKHGWPAPLTYGLALGAAAVGLVGTSLIMYSLPFPNVLLQPDFRWPGGVGNGGGGGLDEFGITVLKFQIVLAGYSLAFGLWYSGS